MARSINPAAPSFTRPMYLNETFVRLLAQEDFQIKFGGNRAYFDVQARRLHLPTWSNLSRNLAIMLQSHEVGHALFTLNEGWMHGLSVEKIPHVYLNIVEDARIERKIQEQYPGLSVVFTAAYRELYERGVPAVLAPFKNIDLNTLSLLDRINMHFKLGSLMFVRFTEAESKLVDMVAATETFDDVIAACHAILLHLKHNPEQVKVKGQPLPPVEAPDDEEGDLSESGDDDGGDDAADDADAEGGEKAEGREKGECASDEDSDDADGESEESDDAADGDGDEGDEGDDGSIGNAGGSDPDAAPLTEEELEALNNQGALYDQIADAMAPTNSQLNELTLPRRGLMMTPGSQNGARRNPVAISSLLARRDAQINAMVREFQMRKAAHASYRAQTSRSGTINTTKLARAKFDTKLFRSRTMLPKAKSHGIVIVLDNSASMRSFYNSAFTRAMEIMEFAKRVGIEAHIVTFSGYCNSNMDAFWAKKSTCVPTHPSMSYTPIAATVLSTEELIGDMYARGLEMVNLFVITDGEEGSQHHYYRPNADAFDPETSRRYVLPSVVGGITGSLSALGMANQMLRDRLGRQELKVHLMYINSNARRVNTFKEVVDMHSIRETDIFGFNNVVAHKVHESTRVSANPDDDTVVDFENAGKADIRSASKKAMNLLMGSKAAKAATTESFMYRFVGAAVAEGF